MRKFKLRNTIGTEEIEAVLKVLKSGNLSQFIGRKGPDFFGGPMIRKFEKNWSLKYGVNFSVAVNSNTSGLMAAIGAIGVNPGDEILVSPWTMSADVAAIINWNCIPVFVDIDSNDFNMDVNKIASKITKRTKAVLVTDIFGCPAKIKEIKKTVGKKINIISDSAQAPWAFDSENNLAGTTADIGVYSLNYHKHIHTGEGGMVVTNDPYLAKNIQLIRNHAESVVSSDNSLINMIGYNFRLGEMEAAIGIEQLKKLNKFVKRQQEIAKYLKENIIDKNKFLEQNVPHGKHNSFYVFPFTTRVSRKKLQNALIKQGIRDVVSGYVNLHTLPMIERKQAYGNLSFPWCLTRRGKSIKYGKGTCPVAEEMHLKTFMYIPLCKYDFTDEDLNWFVDNFNKACKTI